MLVDSKFPEVICDNLILYPEEFCYVVYMPIKVGNILRIPDSLAWVSPLIRRVLWGDYKNYNYIYLTVKHMWVKGCGNREGWHTDGFGSTDTNYIWTDCIPTEFCVQQFGLSEDHNKSLEEMEQQANPSNCVRSKENQLLRLTPFMVHRPYPAEEAILRTFIKVSCSDDVYNLKGNASNPKFPELNWKQVERKQDRNHPVGKIDS